MQLLFTCHVNNWLCWNLSGCHTCKFLAKAKDYVLFTPDPFSLQGKEVWSGDETRRACARCWRLVCTTTSSTAWSSWVCQLQLQWTMLHVSKTDSFATCHACIDLHDLIYMIDGALYRAQFVGPWQLRLCIAYNNATDIKLYVHVHTYAVGVADKAAREGSPHNVVHLSSVQCLQWYVLHNMATLFNNHPYICSSGTPVGTKFTAWNVGMVVE